MASLFLLMTVFCIVNSESNFMQEDALVLVCMDMGTVSKIRSDVIIISKQFTALEMVSQWNKSLRFKMEENIQTDLISYQFHANWTYNEQCINGSAKALRGVHIITKPFSFSGDNDEMIGTAVFRGGGMAEGYSLIPVKHLGDEYFAVTYCEIYGTCQIIIAGIEKAEVTVVLPKNQNVAVTFENIVYSSGDTIKFTIERYESAPISCECDLTGTHIQADNNVAVFSGSKYAIVGVSDRENFLVEQLPPTKNWGTTFVGACFLCSREGSFIRILAAADLTTVDMSGFGMFVISKGQHITRRLQQKKTVYITSTAPILVTMFLLNRLDPITNVFLSSSMYIIAPTNSFAHKNVIGHWLPKTNLKLMLFGTGNVNQLTTEADKLSFNTQDGLHFENSDIIGFRWSGELTQNTKVHTFEGQDVTTTKFSIYGAYLTDDGNTICFGPASVAPSDYQISSNVSYDGDGVDNDADGLVDEDICTEYNPFDDPKVLSIPPKDCKKTFSYGADELGRHFLIVFPNFGNNFVRFTIDIMANIFTPNMESAVDISHVGRKCSYIISEDKNTISNTHTISLPECKSINSIGYHNKGVRLQLKDLADYSQMAVIVSIVGRDTMSSYSALPCDVLGTSYYAITFCKASGDCGCAVTALYSNTAIRIRLPNHNVEVEVNGQYFTARSMITRYLKSAGTTFFFTSKQDLTGTYISAVAPVAVICGGRTETGTFLEQIPPVNALVGKQFPIPIAIPSLLVRLVAKEGNTTVFQIENGNILKRHILPLRGSYIDIRLSDTSVDLLSVSKEGALVAAIKDDEIGDGWMVLLVSKSQIVKELYAKWPVGSMATTLHLLAYNSSQPLELWFFSKLNYISNTVSGITEYTFTDDNIIGIRIPSRNPEFFAFLTGKGGQDSNGTYAVALNRLQYSAKVCKVTISNMADNLDNDCDGYIDEDICVKDYHLFDTSPALPGHYINDYDYDGMIDEDCGTKLNYTILTTKTMESTSMITTSELITASCTTPSPSRLATTTEVNTSPTETDQLSSTIYPSFTNVIESSSVAITPSFMLVTSSSFLQEAVPITTSTYPSSTVPTESEGQCFCSCKKRDQNGTYANMTRETLQRLLKETRKELYLNKASLSLHVRKKTSATDNRTAAKAIGSFGIVLLVLVPGFIIFSDVLSVVRYLHAAKASETLTS